MTRELEYNNKVVNSQASRSVPLMIQNIVSCLTLSLIPMDTLYLFWISAICSDLVCNPEIFSGRSNMKSRGSEPYEQIDTFLNGNLHSGK